MDKAEIDTLRRKAAVLEQLLQAAVDGLRDARDRDDTFSRGQALAYSDLLEVAVDAAEVLELDRTALGMLDLDADAELIGRSKVATA